jgi:SAM-dependent methyltransferase
VSESELNPSPSGHRQPPTRRDRWEKKWRSRAGPQFHWYLSEPPPELVELTSGSNIPAGGALDLGCGPGVATEHIARSFRPAVGVDMVFAAVTEARDLVRSRGEKASFVVAEAPVLPFRAQAFGLVFDRGCLQAIPRTSWAIYFREVERLLKPGGMLQLYVSKAAREFPPLLSAYGIKLRLRWLRGKRGGPQFLSPDAIRRLIPSSMAEVELRQFPFRTSEGKTRNVTYGLFRKA